MSQRVGQKAVRRNSPKRIQEPEPKPRLGIIDLFKARLGWKPQRLQPFYTTAKRECGGCNVIKKADEFDVPITPNRPDLNLCRECENP